MHTTPLSMHGRSALDAVGMAYAREVYVRNESKLQNLSHNLVTTFHETSKGFVDKVIMHMYQLSYTGINFVIQCTGLVFVSQNSPEKHFQNEFSRY